jgi:hypothetical protein
MKKPLLLALGAALVALGLGFAATAEAASATGSINFTAHVTGTISVASNADDIDCAGVLPQTGAQACSTDNNVGTLSVTSNDTWTVTDPGAGSVTLTGTNLAQTFSLAYTVSNSYTDGTSGNGTITVTAGNFGGISTATPVDTYNGQITFTAVTDH